jgi:hypothetical protein
MSDILSVVRKEEGKSGGDERADIRSDEQREGAGGTNVYLK